MLSVFAFGSPRALRPDHNPLHFPTVKTLELLLLVVAHADSTFSRAHAATILRADQEEARAKRALSTDLWRLKKVFSEADLPFDKLINVSHGEIGLARPSGVFADCNELEAAFSMHGATPPEDIDVEAYRQIRSAVERCAGDFAETFEQEWCFLHREKLRSKHHALLNLLMQVEVGRDNWPMAVEWATRLVLLDPLLEHAHRCLMQSHFLMGNRALAIRQFGICRDTLARELGVEPSEETSRMYRGLVSVDLRDISKQPASASADSKPARVPASDKPLTDQLSKALGSIDAARSLVAYVDSALRTSGD